MDEKNLNEIFNPGGPAMRNFNFIGLPFTAETANVILLPVPWDVTVSYGEGTACAPEAVREASLQIDLEDIDITGAWELGIYMQKADESVFRKRNVLRPAAQSYINFLENGGDVKKDPSKMKVLNNINAECRDVNEKVYKESKKIINSGKIAGIVGGDHSVMYGLAKALLGKYDSFGILQVDAHMDLRKCYEGFQYSHASVFNNILREEAISKLVQVGIRDYCEEEMERVKAEHGRISVFFDQKMKENRFRGMDWDKQCHEIVDQLPANVYISIDVDGLDPKLCPHAGTPVPGGMEFFELIFILKKLVESGRKIIGFDLCETGNSEWDANVGARILYKLCNLAGRSQGWI
jgi:agmatinase